MILLSSAPLARSSSTSTSCSADILKSAVTLYLLVFLLVSRRVEMPPGEAGWSWYAMVNEGGGTVVRKVRDKGNASKGSLEAAPALLCRQQRRLGWKKRKRWEVRGGGVYKVAAENNTNSKASTTKHSHHPSLSDQIKSFHPPIHFHQDY